MSIDFRRRSLVLGSATAAALAQFGVAPGAFAQSGRLSVPTVDSLTIRVITDSSYDTPRVGTSKWVKTRRAGLVSAARTCGRRCTANGASRSRSSRASAPTRARSCSISATRRTRT